MLLDAGMRSFAAALVVLALVAPWACQASSAGATQSMLPLLAVEDFEESKHYQIQGSRRLSDR